MFTAACADQLSGLHGPKGKPCPARPWVCLLCPLAVFAPRHAANLLRLKAFFSRQWRQMPAAQFMAVFGPYAGPDRPGPGPLRPRRPRRGSRRWSPTPTTRSRCARRSCTDDDRRRQPRQHDLIGRRSPVPTSAARPAWHCLTGHAARSSTTTCGTSPTWSGCRSRCPWRTGASTSPRSPTRAGGWSPRSSIAGACSPRAIERSRRCRAPIARPCTCAAAIGRLDEAIRFFGWLRRRGISDLGADRHAGLRGIPGFPALPHRRGRHRRRRAEPSVTGARPPRSSSTWSTTGSCSPPTRVRPACAPGAGRPPPRWPRCRRGGPRTRPSRSPRRSCSRCSPPRCTW